MYMLYLMYIFWKVIIITWLAEPSTPHLMLERTSVASWMRPRKVAP